MAFKSPFQDDPLKRAKTGFQVVPNLPPEPLPNLPLQQLPTPFSPQEQPSGGMIHAGDRTMAITPTATYTNFPTARDAVTQSVQRIQQMRQGQVASPVPTNALPGSSLTPPPLTPISQTVAGQYMTKDEQDRAQSQQVFAQQAMIGRDPNTERYDPARMRVVKMTPQEQEQAWSDAKVQETAGLPGTAGVAGKTDTAAPIQLLSGKTEMDTHFIRTVPRKQWPSALQAMAKDVDQRLPVAFASMPKEVDTEQELQDFVGSLGFSPLIAQYLKDSTIGLMKKYNEPLYLTMMGNKKADAANKQKMRNYYYDNAPGAGDFRPDEVDAAIEAMPEAEKQVLRNAIAEEHYNPVTGQSELTPKGLAVQEAETAETKRKMTEQLEDQTLRDEIAASGGKYVEGVNAAGKLIKMTPLQAEKEQRKADIEQSKLELDYETADLANKAAALANKRDLRAQEAADRQAEIYAELKKNTIGNKKFKSLPAASRGRVWEKIIALETGTDKSVAEGYIDPVDAITQAQKMRDVYGLNDAEKTTAPHIATPPTAQGQGTPTATERTATMPDGTKLTVRNGQWVPQQTTTPAPAPEVKPVAEAAPLVTPPTVAPPVQPPATATPTPPKVTPPTDTEVIKFVSGLVAGKIGEVRDTIKGVQEKVVDAVVVAKVRQLSRIPAVKIARYEAELGKAAVNKLLDYGRRKMAEERKKQNPVK